MQDSRNEMVHSQIDVLCKTAASPLLTYWRYCSLAISHQNVISWYRFPILSWYNRIFGIQIGCHIVSPIFYDLTLSWRFCDDLFYILKYISGVFKWPSLDYDIPNESFRLELNVHYVYGLWFCAHVLNIDSFVAMTYLLLCVGTTLVMIMVVFVCTF